MDGKHGDETLLPGGNADNFSVTAQLPIPEQIQFQMSTDAIAHGTPQPV
ncbi:hypothetical protein [Pseudarthrobacter equi]|nr:hypothetical protein [Pseudarthrobacter equi]